MVSFRKVTYNELPERNQNFHQKGFVYYDFLY